MTVEIIYIYT